MYYSCILLVSFVFLKRFVLVLDLRIFQDIMYMHKMETHFGQQHVAMAVMHSKAGIHVYSPMPSFRKDSFPSQVFHVRSHDSTVPSWCCLPQHRTHLHCCYTMLHLTAFRALLHPHELREKLSPTSVCSVAFVFDIRQCVVLICGQALSCTHW